MIRADDCFALLSTVNAPRSNGSFRMLEGRKGCGCVSFAKRASTVFCTRRIEFGSDWRVEREREIECEWARVNGIENRSN